MTIEIKSTDERTVEQATAMLRAQGYKVVGRVINGVACLCGVKK